jgi:pyridoxamine 5'-phosphate oxidase family protein
VIRVVDFTGREVEFLKGQRLGRLATVSSSGQPHVVPVAYDFDGKFIYFGGYNLADSLKFRNIRENSKVAFVVDDLVSVKPWNPRGVEIRGVAEMTQRDGNLNIRITPLAKASWGRNLHQ